MTIPQTSLIGLMLEDATMGARSLCTYPFVDGEYFDEQDFSYECDQIFLLENEILRSAEILAVFVEAA